MTAFNTSRDIQAPIEKIFAAISDPARLARWWGPAGFTNTFHLCEFKRGGRWTFIMHGPDGKNYPNENVFAEIDPPHKVVIDHMSEPKFRLTIALSASETGTLVSWSQAVENVEFARSVEHIVVPSNEQNLDRLTVEVFRISQGDPTKITVETTVAAPADAVWRAYTSPEDIMQWNAASDDWHTTAATVDLRVGGAFSSRMEAKDGSFGFDFAGTYTAIVPHKLIAYSFGDRMAKVDFAETPDGVTVRVCFDAETTHSVEQQRDGWQAILNNFASHVEQRQRAKR
jgi:uncharacterized protein YndB with AHSA1/START domain